VGSAWDPAVGPDRQVGGGTIPSSRGATLSGDLWGRLMGPAYQVGGGTGPSGWWWDRLVWWLVGSARSVFGTIPSGHGTALSGDLWGRLVGPACQVSGGTGPSGWWWDHLVRWLVGPASQPMGLDGTRLSGLLHRTEICKFK
jgi:hypothetical protein